MIELFVYSERCLIVNTIRGWVETNSNIISEEVAKRKEFTIARMTAVDISESTSYQNETIN